MKVLIADDEMKVCQLIVQLVNWASYNMEIVAVVNDGKAAYEAICELHPDIVITDIRMPNYDGLELIQRTKENFSDMYFVIISGHSEFGYAQNAIQHGVVDYLLKPLKKKGLEATLAKIQKDYEASIHSSQTREKMEQIIEKSKEKVKQNLLSRWVELANSDELARKSATSNEDMDTINKQYQCSFAQGYFQAFIIRPFMAQESTSGETIAFIFSKLQQLLSERLEKHCLELLADIHNGELLCVINTATDEFADVKKQLNRVKLDIQNLREIFGSIQLMVGVGKCYATIEHIIQSIAEANSALKGRMIDSNSFILKYDDDTVAISNKNLDLIDLALRDKIWAYQERFDVEGLLAEVNTYLDEVVKERATGELVYETFFELIDILRFGMKNYGEEFSFPTQEEWKKKYQDTLNYEQLRHTIIKEISLGYSKYNEWKKNVESKPIRIAKQHIFEHYNEQLSLEVISDLVGFNPAYFSSLFKKESGKNFSEYVMEIRIQHAKTFLIQTRNEVAVIAELVGYSDLKYFSKLFKKITGLNPSEYRKIYG